jgi:hypothetical protein
MRAHTQRMANLGDLIDALGSEDSTAIGLAGDVMGTLADFSGAAGFISMFTDLIQPPDAQLQQALANIQASIDTGFRELQGDVAAEGILAKERDIDSGINPEAAIFALLPTIVSELPTLPESYILTQLETCVASVQFFTDYADKWEIPWASLTPYTDAWSGTVAPPQSPFIFNYTYVLPQFLRAIYMFQTVLLALQPDALGHADVQALLKKCAAKLQSVHDTMTAGIVGTRLPATSDVAELGYDGNFLAWNADWYGGPPPDPNAFWKQPSLWPFGAVEIYSGLNNIQSYTAFEPYEFLPDQTPLPQAFVSLVQLRIENARKAMYVQLGLPVVRQAINRLLALTGQPALPGIPYQWWSLDDAASVLGIAAAGQTSFWTELTALLRHMPPYDGGQLFPPDIQQYYPAAPLPTSFLSLFTPTM